MTTQIRQNDCPCCKGEYCTNGLKCTEQNCFLIKSSTVMPKPLAISIDSLNPILSILVSDYRQIQSFWHRNIRGLGDFTFI